LFLTIFKTFSSIFCSFNSLLRSSNSFLFTIIWPFLASLTGKKRLPEGTQAKRQMTVFMESLRVRIRMVEGPILTLYFSSWHLFIYFIYCFLTDSLSDKNRIYDVTKIRVNQAGFVKSCQVLLKSVQLKSIQLDSHTINNCNLIVK